VGDLAKIFKAYDIRGVVPDELDEETAQAVGAAFVRVTGATAVVTANDMRSSSGPLSAAFARGATAQGADVIEAGLGSTDMLYYASGSLDLPGAMFTASHNPARYNGIKLCRAGAAPVGRDSGLTEIRRLVEAGPIAPMPGAGGTVTGRDLLADYAAHLRRLVDLSGIRPLKVVVDAGNGMGGHTVPAVLGDAKLPALPLDIVPLYFELDGTFPNHEANPIEPANLRDLQAAVVEHQADIGIAFDGDADRCWIIDEAGKSVAPSTITALVAVRELAKHPGSAVIHNLITSRYVPEIIKSRGGTPIRTRVGHSFIKEKMAETGAVFGGEHSAHYYFADFWRADTGMLAAMHVLAALGGQPRRLSDLLAEYSRYVASGEINSEVADQDATTVAVRAAFGGRPGVTIDELDGLTVGHANWWFNLRPSNTEPLLRLNAEAVDEQTMAKVRDEVLALVRKEV
jgi:phosphomannomutase